MERSGRHPPKAATVVIRAALGSEETGSAFHPGSVLYNNTNTVYGSRIIRTQYGLVKTGGYIGLCVYCGFLLLGSSVLVVLYNIARVVDQGTVLPVAPLYSYQSHLLDVVQKNKIVLQNTKTPSSHQNTLWLRYKTRIVLYSVV